MEGVIGAAVYYRKVWFVGLVVDGIVEFMSVRVKAWWWCFFIFAGERERERERGTLCVEENIKREKKKRQTFGWEEKKKKKKKRKKRKIGFGLAYMTGGGHALNYSFHR